MSRYWLLIGTALLGLSCGGNPDPQGPGAPNVPGIDFGQLCKLCPQPTPCPSAAPCPSPSPYPTPTPTPSPSPTPQPSPTATPAPSPSPTAEPSPSPTPVPSPPALNCGQQFKPTTTGFSLLACTLNNKLICGGGQGKKCDCSGAGCTFELPVGAACDGDSTPRHDGELPNWKTCTCLDHGDELPCNEWPVCVDGKVERSEYPPRPAYGWECAGITKWDADAAVEVNPEGDGYGARLKFPKAGTHNIKVCRADGSQCTSKKARIK